MNQKITHSELCQKGASWLRNNHDFVAVELATVAGEVPDVIGWNRYQSTLIECKVSRTDYGLDECKWCRRDGMGVGSYRYYLVPDGLISPEECRSGWGLLYLAGSRIKVVTPAPLQERHVQHENTILISALRRLRESMGVKAFYAALKQG